MRRDGTPSATGSPARTDRSRSTSSFFKTERSLSPRASPRRRLAERRSRPSRCRM
jgi:hypothetical protein